MDACVADPWPSELEVQGPEFEVQGPAFVPSLSLLGCIPLLSEFNSGRFWVWFWFWFWVRFWLFWVLERVLLLLLLLLERVGKCILLISLFSDPNVCTVGTDAIILLPTPLPLVTDENARETSSLLFTPELTRSRSVLIFVSTGMDPGPDPGPDSRILPDPAPVALNPLG